MTVGIDEVGRGSWAGPLCVAAVAWPEVRLKGLADSKLVPRAKRPGLAWQIRDRAADIGFGWVSAKFIDEHGLTNALKLAARRALGQLNVAFESVIIDGNLMLIDDARAQTVVKADNTIPAVMAASVVAKVARDRYMAALDRTLGHYQFSRHVGYGTKLHQAVLAEFGPSPQHRLSFAPLKT